MTENFNVEPLVAGQVRIKTDAPGQRATSVVMDAKEAITTIAEAAGLTVIIESDLPPEAATDNPPATEQPPADAVVEQGDEVDLSQPQPGEPQVDEAPQAGQLPANEPAPQVPAPEGEDEDPPAF